MLVAQLMKVLAASCASEAKRSWAKRSSQAMVNGEVVLETRGGRVDAVAVRSPHILNAKGATYAQAADWGVAEAEGFIRLYGMSSTLWAEVNR